MVDWNNHIMKKFGGSIRKKIAEAYDPFVKGTVLVAADKAKRNKTDMVKYAVDSLDETI